MEQVKPRLPSVINGLPVVAAVALRHGAAVLVRQEDGQLVSWMTDSNGNAFWGAYGTEAAVASFMERMQRALTTFHSKGT